MGVFAKIADGNEVTQTERWTLRHCLLAFKWTEPAHDWIIEECKKLKDAGKYTDGGPKQKKLKTDPNDPKETVDGVECDGGIMEECRKAVAGQGDGRVSIEDAKKIFKQAQDDNELTQMERWTLRYCMTEFNWTRPAHDFFVDELKKVPGAQTDE